jgi:hypothetical protein
MASKFSAYGDGGLHPEKSVKARQPPKMPSTTAIPIYPTSIQKKMW